MRCSQGGNASRLYNRAPWNKVLGLKFEGLKYYPLCGFDSGQFLNKRLVRKLEFGQGLQFGFWEESRKLHQHHLGLVLNLASWLAKGNCN